MSNTHSNRRSPLMPALFCLFLMGGSLYYLLEVLLRGWSHWTMAVCGGICLSLIYLMNIRLGNAPLLFRASAGAFIITAVELLAGYWLNLHLGLGIWDYSTHAHHLWGQISFYASARWLLLCIPVCLGCSALRKYVFEYVPTPPQTTEEAAD